MEEEIESAVCIKLTGGTVVLGGLPFRYLVGRNSKSIVGELRFLSTDIL